MRQLLPQTAYATPAKLPGLTTCHFDPFDRLRINSGRNPLDEIPSSSKKISPFIEISACVAAKKLNLIAPLTIEDIRSSASLTANLHAPSACR
jgi:hypothetical protein